MVEEPVANSLCDRGLVDQMVPLFGWVLTGDDGGGLSVAILDDLQEVSAFGIG